MNTDRFLTEATDGPSPLERREETRRSLLAKAGLIAGGAGLVTLARPREALAATRDELMFDGYNNVKDYGAAGDGVTDDTVAINAAITDSAQNAAVYFPPGTYIISRFPAGDPSLRGIEVPDKTILVGHGPLSVIKKGGANSGGAVILNKDAAGNNDVIIQDLTVDGNAGNANAATFLIKFAGERVVIRRVEGRNNGSSFNFALSNMKNAAIRDCYIHNGGRDGINLSSSQDVLIQGNLIHDCGDDHIAVSSPRVSVIGNVVNAASTPNGAAIAARGGDDGVKIVGNVCRAGSQGTIVVNSNFGTVKNLEIADNVCVEAGNTSAPSPNRGSPDGSGIVVFMPSSGSAQDIARVNVRDNVIAAPRNHGVMVVPQNAGTSAAMSDIAVSGNMIWIDQSAAYANGAGSGIACISPAKDITDIRISDNDIRGAAGPGIQVSKGAGTPKRFDILGNRILDSGKSGASKSGVLVDGADDVAVIGNRAQDSRSSGKTQDYGLTITNPTGEVVVADNTFTDNASGTVNFSARAAGASRLRMRDNPGFNPWTGEASWTGGWSGLMAPFTVEVSVTFPVPFPSGNPPEVFCTVRDLDAYAVAKNVSNTGFTLRVVSETNPSSTQKAAWLAEPRD